MTEPTRAAPLAGQPVTPGDAPVTPAVQPVTPGDAPVTPAGQHVIPSDAPVTPAVQPVTPGDAPVTPADQPVIPPVPPGMVPSLRALAPQLVVAGLLPLVGYALLRPHVGSDAVALTAVMVFPLGEITFERVRRHRFEPIGAISLIGIAVGIVGAVALNGDATLLKVRESALTGLFGLVCLGSLGARRPTMFYLGRSFATGGEPTKAAEFDTLWELPGVPARFRRITAVWAVGLIAEAAARTVLALDVPTQVFLEVSPLLNWGVLGGLLWYTTVFTRASERKVRAGLEAA